MWVDYDVPNLFPTLKISSGRRLQNGRHNNAQIQHCPISTKFQSNNVELVRYCGGHFENGNR
jgi:hypothetical protein